MAEAFLKLSQADQREILELAREKTDRPSHLLEMDVWVVWALGVLFESPLASDLTFKGGTSLSKAYKVIDRFSEDIDLTCDIRKLIGDLTDNNGSLPTNRSQASKWSKAVRERLPDWIATNVKPIIEAALAREQIDATLKIAGKENEQLLLQYTPLQQGTGYVAPAVILEFGGRATGEPHQVMPIVCDMDGHIPGVTFPKASPVVMSVARTFWEKATAAHVYCAQGRIRGERYARHWHDLAALGRSPLFKSIIADRDVALCVARHKTFFFMEKNFGGDPIEYLPAVTGSLNIVPTGAARAALEDDYAHMLADQIMLGEALPFEHLMHACGDVESMANGANVP